MNTHTKPSTTTGETDYRVAFLALIITALASILCVLFLDRPTANFSHTYLRPHRIFALFTHIVDPVWPLATLALIVAAIRSLSGRFVMTPMWQTVLLTSLAVIASITLKDQLKFVFGRTWPETWIGDNPSLVAHDAYEFHFFHGGQGWASFPSGHMTQSVALCAMLLFLRPRFRAVWISYVVVVAVSLYGANFHFLGDMFAGAFIGIFSAAATLSLWNLVNARKELPHGG